MSRDLPVLDAVVRQANAEIQATPTVNEIAAATGMDAYFVAQALDALNGVYLDLQVVSNRGDPGLWRVEAIYPRARTAVGQWPTPASLADGILAGLEGAAQAADSAGDGVKAGHLRELSAMLGGELRQVFVDVAAAVISKQVDGV